RRVQCGRCAAACPVGGGVVSGLAGDRRVRGCGRSVAPSGGGVLGQPGRGLLGSGAEQRRSPGDASAGSAGFLPGSGGIGGRPGAGRATVRAGGRGGGRDRKSTRLNSSHVKISYAVFCLKKKDQGEYGREGR